jgi:hypothetical protein
VLSALLIDSNSQAIALAPDNNDEDATTHLQAAPTTPPQKFLIFL